MLFQRGAFTLHSGGISTFKIDCDALSDADIETSAAMLAEVLSPFGTVEPVLTGGLRLATALALYATDGPLLIVDDVLTTGRSMEAQRRNRQAIGAVLFARGSCPSWVTALWSTPLHR